MLTNNTKKSFKNLKGSSPTRLPRLSYATIYLFERERERERDLDRFLDLSFERERDLCLCLLSLSRL